MEVGAATHVGLVRERNEDAYHVDAARGVALVADGLGGHTAGDIASKLAVDVIVSGLNGVADDPPTALVRSLEEANDAILDDSADHAERRGMGTTAVLAYLPDSGTRAWVAHVGDSRAYVLRDDHLIQVTQDHTTGGPFGRGQITQALGSHGGVEPDCVDLELAAGDRLLLCTDGLTDMLSDREIADLAGNGRTPQEACDALISASLSRGGVDNVTVVTADAPG